MSKKRKKKSKINWRKKPPEPKYTVTFFDGQKPIYIFFNFVSFKQHLEHSLIRINTSRFSNIFFNICLISSVLRKFYIKKIGKKLSRANYLNCSHKFLYKAKNEPEKLPEATCHICFFKTRHVFP